VADFLGDLEKNATSLYLQSPEMFKILACGAKDAHSGETRAIKMQIGTRVFQNRPK